MAVNRFYRRTPYDIGLYVPPVDAVREGLQQAQKQYDTNYILASQVKEHFINSLPQDRQAANEIQQRWQGQVDQIVNDAGQDYSKIGRSLGKLMSDIRREYNPGGKAHAITSNFGNYSKWLAEHQERVAKGNILGQDLNLANNYFMTKYTGVGEIDPVTGAYNRFEPETLTDYQDPNKIIQDVYKEFKPEKYKVGKSWVENGMINYQETEQEGITAERLNPSFQTALIADPKFASYLRQRVKFSGQDPAAAGQFINAYASQRAQDLSYMNESDIMKMERDPLAVARAKAAMDKENIDYMMSLQQFGETTNGLLTVEPTFDPDNWRNNLDSAWEAGRPLPGGYGIGLSYNPDAKPHAAEKTNLQEFISGKNDEKIQAKWNVTPDLLRTHWQNKVSWTPEFQQKYGKDPKWTAEFEKNFMHDIKKIAPSHSSYQIVEQEIPDPARNQNLHRAIRAAASGGWPVSRPGSPTTIPGGIPKDIAELLYDEDTGKFKDLDIYDITYVQPGPGIRAAGYKIATPKGSIIIEDQHGSRKQHSDRMAAAFSPIFFGGKKMGAGNVTYHVDEAGNKYRGKPYRQFELDPTLAAQGIVKYNDNTYMVEPWSTVDNPEWIYEQTPQGPQRIKRSPAQIAEYELPEFHGSLGFGSSKAEQTAHPFFLFGQ